MDKFCTRGRGWATWVTCLWLFGCTEPAPEPPQQNPAAPVSCDASPSTHGDFPPELAQALQQNLEAHLEATRAPGVAAVVVLPGSGTWFGAAGLANTETQAPMEAGARFRVGSITKTFTAAAVMKNVEEGRWRLDDPVDDWVPGWDLGPSVTLRRLLNHTTGIFNYTDDGAFLGKSYQETPPGEVIGFALSHDAPMAPGEGYYYSNTGYYLLGLALEAVEGRPYHEVLRDRFHTPLGLPQTFMEGYEVGACTVVQGHLLGDPGPTEGFSMSWAWAAGGLVSTVEDLCEWGQRLFVAGEVVSEASLSQMIAPEPLSQLAGEPYGLGVRVTTRGGLDVLGHTGSTMGFNGELFVHPASGACVAVQTNDFFGAHDEASQPLWASIAPMLGE